MKVLIVSDTHKIHTNFDLAVKAAGRIDLLIHLGDVEGQEDYIINAVSCPVHIVGGNNDFFSDLPREEEFFIAGYHVFITHGHNYFVGLAEERLIEEARGRGADIVMYGHTHRPIIEQLEDLVVLNPGSLSYPRQEGRRGSYIIMDVDTEGRAAYELKFL